MQSPPRPRKIRTKLPVLEWRKQKLAEGSGFSRSPQLQKGSHPCQRDSRDLEPGRKALSQSGVGCCSWEQMPTPSLGWRPWVRF